MAALGSDATSGEPLPPEVLDEFVAAGDSATCQAMVTRLRDAGADRVVLVPNPAGFRSTDSMIEQIRKAAGIVADIAG